MLRRVEQVLADLQRVVDRLKVIEDFEPVHAGRWRHLSTHVEVETGYSYGEGVIRVFDPGNHRAARERLVLLGRPNDLDHFNSLFPTS